MIHISEIIAQFINELDGYIIDATTSGGVTFYHANRPGLKFGICTPPLWGVKSNEVGFVVTKNGYPYKDSIFEPADPLFFEKVKKRIIAWVDGDLNEVDGLMGI